MAKPAVEKTPPPPATLAVRLARAEEAGAKLVNDAMGALERARADMAAAARKSNSATAAIENTTSQTPGGELEKLVVAKEVARLRAGHATTDVARAERACASALANAASLTTGVLDNEALTTAVRPLMAVLAKQFRLQAELASLGAERDALFTRAGSLSNRWPTLDHILESFGPAEGITRSSTGEFVYRPMAVSK